MMFITNQKTELLSSRLQFTSSSQAEANSQSKVFAEKQRVKVDDSPNDPPDSTVKDNTSSSDGTQQTNDNDENHIGRSTLILLLSLFILVIFVISLLRMAETSSNAKQALHQLNRTKKIEIVTILNTIISHNMIKNFKTRNNQVNEIYDDSEVDEDNDQASSQKSIN